MYHSLLLGLLMMMSGAALAFLSLPDKHGQSPFFMTRSGLALIYPAIILSLLSLGAIHIVVTAISR